MMKICTLGQRMQKTCANLHQILHRLIYACCVNNQVNTSDANKTVSSRQLCNLGTSCNCNQNRTARSFLDPNLSFGDTEDTKNKCRTKGEQLCALHIAIFVWAMFIFRWKWFIKYIYYVLCDPLDPQLAHRKPNHPIMYAQHTNETSLICIFKCLKKY